MNALNANKGKKIMFGIIFAHDCMCGEWRSRLAVTLTLLQQLLKDEAAHVDRPAGGGVVHGVVLGVDLVVQHRGSLRPVRVHTCQAKITQM